MNRQSAGNRIKEIIQFYQTNKSIIGTAKEFSVSYETIRNVLRNNGFVSNRKKPINSKTLNLDYFSIIDTQDKAYFLGFIKADGYIDQKRNRLAIRISEEDVIILKMFCDAVNLPVERINYLKRDQQSKYFSKNRKDTVEVAITNEHFINNIKDVKSESILSKIPSNLIYHFIRGYFDGDGSISYVTKTKNVRFQMNIQGSPSDDHMLKFICKYFNFKIYKDRRSDLPIISSSNTLTLLDFQDKIYKDSYVCLYRKKIKFDNLKFLYELSSTTTRETTLLVEDIV